MPQFSYKARRRSGELVEGVLDVADRSAAVAQIERLGLFPVAVDTAKAGAVNGAVFQVSGRGGVSGNSVAVTGNLTVTGQTSLGYLYIGPGAVNNPTTSTLNFPKGDDRANGVTVALGVGGTLSVTYAAPPSGPIAQVIFDVTGYFAP